MAGDVIGAKIAVAELGSLGAALATDGAVTAPAVAGLKGSTQGVHSLFHYTDEAGMVGILQSKYLKPSLLASNPADARYGNGQYLTDIIPGTRTASSLSREFLGMPFQGKRFTNYVEIDVRGLDVVQGRQSVFVVPNEKPLDLINRILTSGKN
jgi:hypothetical protein